MASAKGQIINILGLTPSTKLYLYKQVVGWIWPSSRSLLISELHELYCPFQW